MYWIDKSLLFYLAKCIKRYQSGFDLGTDREVNNVYFSLLCRVQERTAKKLRKDTLDKHISYTKQQIIPRPSGTNTHCHILLYIIRSKHTYYIRLQTPSLWDFVPEVVSGFLSVAMMLFIFPFLCFSLPIIRVFFGRKINGKCYRTLENYVSEVSVRY